jgi:hypothetical protein
MKSNLFKRGTAFDDDDIKGISTLCGLSNEEFTSYLNWYATKIKENSPRKPKDILPLTGESKYSAKEIIDAFKVCFSIVYSCFEDKENIENITDDLVEADIIKEECKNIFLQRFKNAYDVFEAEIRSDYEQESTTGYGNRLLGYDIKCEIVPKFEPEFKVFKHKIEDYATKIENLYPVVKLELVFEDNGKELKNISFYLVNENTIDNIIDSLLAAKIQLNEIKIIKSKIFSNK